MSRSLERLFFTSPARVEWQSPGYPLSEDPALVGFEWAMNDTHNFLRCGRCREIVAAWVSLVPPPASAASNAKWASKFKHKCPRAGETIEPYPEVPSAIEMVRATAFAYHYTNIREMRISPRSGEGEPIDNPNEKELKLVADDAMILANDAAKKYAERLAKRAKKEST